MLFRSVGYKAIKEVVDGLGGVYINVDSEELKHINNYQIGISEFLGQKSYKEVKTTGYQLLDGLQAAAYCRIRYTAGDDFRRAERQREVLQAIEEQAKKANISTLTKLLTSVLDNVYTSISKTDLLELVTKIADYKIVDEGGFPTDTQRTTGTLGSKGSCVIPTDLQSNVVWLHKFLFDVDDYQPTSNVIEYSRIIKSDTSPYLNKN